MATTGRDYYEVLGVPRTAPEADIKRAFRQLARELHPDVSAEPDADTRFKEVVEAYEVLSKSETRELYDRFGHAGLRSGGFRPTPFDLGSLADIFSAFFGDDAFGVATGARRAGSGHRCRDRDLARGSRDGDHAGRPRAGCDPLRGVRRRRRPAGNSCRLARTARHWSHPAHLPDGLRRVHPQPGLPALQRHRPVVEHPCETCSGAGRVLEERSLDVEVPAGIHDGQRIRLSGEGTRGRSAASRATCTSSCASVLTSALSAKATTSTRRSISR